MKTKLTILFGLLAIAAITLTVKAGVITLIGSGATINANSTSNFTALAQVGTFNMGQQNLYLTSGSETNTALVTVFGRLTFDGTNYFTISQTFTNSTTNAYSGQLWAVTNLSLPVYGSLSVSNGNNQAVSNFQAQLQF